MRIKRIHLILLAAALICCGCKHHPTKVYDPAKVGFLVSYNPNLEGQLYSSMVLAQAGYQGTEQHPLFTLSVTAPTDNAVLRVVLDSSMLNYVTITQEVLPKKGQTYTFTPLVKWKYNNLYAIRQQGAVDLTFTCFINDEEVDVKNLRLNYRSVNECLISFRDTAGKVQDYRWLFAAYVNEEHPYIDKILEDILHQGFITRFTGYQLNSNSVTDQMMAIWYYALNRGISYSSISCTANPSKRANVQHIRFFDEVYNNRQANCIDACVYFASIMRKIGLKPVIFVEPCHAYLGYYTDKNRKRIALLETTITGWINLPEMEKQYNEKGQLTKTQMTKIAKYMTADQYKQFEEGKMTFDTMKRTVARTLFLKATEYNKENYANNKQYFADTSAIGYQQLDIENLRSQVQPINFVN